MKPLTEREVIVLARRCGMRVCSIEEYHGCPYGDESMVDCAERLEADYEAAIDRLLEKADRMGEIEWFATAERALELAKADAAGMVKIVKRPPEGKACGSCADFIRERGTAYGLCRTQLCKRGASRGKPRNVSQSRRACTEYKPVENVENGQRLEELAGVQKEEREKL